MPGRLYGRAGAPGSAAVAMDAVPMRRIHVGALVTAPAETLRQRLISALVESECMRNDRGAWVKPRYNEAGRMADVVAHVLSGRGALDPVYLAQERGEAPEDVRVASCGVTPKED